MSVDAMTEEELIRLGRRYLALHKQDRGPWPLEFREKLRILEDEYDSEEHPIDTVSFQHYEGWVNRCEHFETRLSAALSRVKELEEALEGILELHENGARISNVSAEETLRRARSVLGGE